MFKNLKVLVTGHWQSIRAFRAFRAFQTFCLGFLICVCATNYSVARPIDVFAAASLKEPLDELSAAYFVKTGTNVRISYASSSVLARQIEYGAPVDVFISANLGWMKYLDGEGLLMKDVHPIAFNRLIFASYTSERLELNTADIIDRLAGGKLAIPLMDAVPLGLYARQALQNLGLLDALKPHMVYYDNARSSLIPVLRGEVELGIIYASDMTFKPDLYLAAEIPENSHEKITYAAAQLVPYGAGFVQYLLQPEAHAVFKSHGFSSP
jgi:molybdate transport system substrate-binding protein